VLAADRVAAEDRAARRRVVVEHDVSLVLRDVLVCDVNEGDHAAELLLERVVPVGDRLTDGGK
jgi:hypothetical protein